MRKLFYIFGLLLLVGCGAKEDQKETLRNVYVVDAVGSDGNGNLLFTGVLEESHNIGLGFKTAGQISRIYVKEGDRVAKGKLLAELDNSDYRLGVEALQIQYDQLSREVARAKKLYEKKSMSGNDYDKAVSGLSQLAVQLKVNKNKLAYTRLYAPASGIIEKVNFSVAEMVDAGTCVFNLLEDSGMEIVCDIPLSSYLQRESFGEISCVVLHGDGRIIPLTLKSIVPKADSNQLYRLRLALGKGDVRGLTSGMNVEVRIHVNSDRSGVMTLPASAVMRHDGKTCVWVLQKDSTIRRCQITVGNTLKDGRIVVESGISAGQKVVRSGVGMLHENEKVKVIEYPSETNVGREL